MANPQVKELVVQMIQKQQEALDAIQAFEELTKQHVALLREEYVGTRWQHRSNGQIRTIEQVWTEGGFYLNGPMLSRLKPGNAIASFANGSAVADSTGYWLESDIRLTNLVKSYKRVP